MFEIGIKVLNYFFEIWNLCLYQTSIFYATPIYLLLILRKSIILILLLAIKYLKIITVTVVKLKCIVLLNYLIFSSTIENIIHSFTLLLPWLLRLKYVFISLDSSLSIYSHIEFYWQSIIYKSHQWVWSTFLTRS